MLIDWKKIAIKIYDELKNKVVNSENKITLGAILVWNNEASIRYIKQKKKWADYIWINFVLKRVEKDISTEQLLDIINDFNISEKITWFIVQLPLPEHINEKSIIEAISPLKDVDGFHPVNIWKLLIWDNSNKSLFNLLVFYWSLLTTSTGHCIFRPSKYSFVSINISECAGET